MHFRPIRSRYSLWLLPAVLAIIVLVISPDVYEDGSLCSVTTQEDMWVPSVLVLLPRRYHCYC